MCCFVAEHWSDAATSDRPSVRSFSDAADSRGAGHPAAAAYSTVVVHYHGEARSTGAAHSTDVAHYHGAAHYPELT
jgi:hypothetical protein